MNRHLVLGVLGINLIITGCAQKGIANQDAFDQLAHQKAEEFIGNTLSALEKAEDVYGQARAENLPELTPLHWQQLTESIKKARSADLEGESSASLEAAAWVMTLYDSAQQSKQRVEQQLADILAQQQVLLSIKTDKILRRPYRDSIDDLKTLARHIESGQTRNLPDDANDLLKDMQALERDTMLELHWRPARKTLDKSEDEGSDDFAPETFAIAERLTRDVKKTITERYQDRLLCESTGLKALRAAQHALYIGREAESIINMDIDDSEEAALRLEGYLHQIATALEAGDLRNMSFLDQTLALVQKAHEQRDKAVIPLKKEIDALKQELLQYQTAQAENPVEHEESRGHTDTSHDASDTAASKLDTGDVITTAE